MGHMKSDGTETIEVIRNYIRSGRTPEIFTRNC